MAEARPTECSNCGAPVTAESTCRYCGSVVKGHPASSKPRLAPELSTAIERLRAGQVNPASIVDRIADGLQQSLPKGAIKRSTSFGAGRRLEIRLGTLVYSFRFDGRILTVERQSVAGGFAVGMKDALPATRWPEQFVKDVAENADAAGQDWRAVVLRL